MMPVFVAIYAERDSAEKASECGKSDLQGTGDGTSSRRLHYCSHGD